MPSLEKKLRQAILSGIADYEHARSEYEKAAFGEMEQPNIVQFIYARVEEVLRAQKFKSTRKRTR